MDEAAGRKNWVFGDGDLPPGGSTEPKGHEALMITNLNSGRDADITIDILFEDREPVKGIKLKVAGERVRCIRLDQPVGDGVNKYSIPKGQYALVLHSSVPVVAVFGRLDVRQPNMSYYSVQGYGY